MGISKIKTSLIIAFSIVTDSSATLAETLAALRENSIIQHTTFEVPAHLNSELSAFLRSEGSNVKNYFNNNLLEHGLFGGGLPPVEGETEKEKIERLRNNQDAKNLTSMFEKCFPFELPDIGLDIDLSINNCVMDDALQMLNGRIDDRVAMEKDKSITDPGDSSTVSKKETTQTKVEKEGKDIAKSAQYPKIGVGGPNDDKTKDINTKVITDSINEENKENLLQGKDIVEIRNTHRNKIEASNREATLEKIALDNIKIGHQMANRSNIVTQIYNKSVVEEKENAYTHFVKNNISDSFGSLTLPVFFGDSKDNISSNLASSASNGATTSPSKGKVAVATDDDTRKTVKITNVLSTSKNISVTTYTYPFQKLLMNNNFQENYIRYIMRGISGAGLNNVDGQSVINKGKEEEAAVLKKNIADIIDSSGGFNPESSAIIGNKLFNAAISSRITGGDVDKEMTYNMTSQNIIFQLLMINKQIRYGNNTQIELLIANNSHNIARMNKMEKALAKANALNERVVSLLETLVKIQEVQIAQ
ncbi:MAG: hypothetical protein HOG49_43800 [Candidatus Scalindua sp.]|nr:hypothetical protein [Candidatus Scalindua sp.]